MLTAATVAIPSPAFAVADFATPNGAAYCGTEPTGRGHRLVCWTPNDGFTVAMKFRAAPTKRYVPANRDLHADVRVLAWDRLVRLPGGFRCVSRRSGLTCRNTTGHGWWLGRYRGYRLF